MNYEIFKTPAELTEKLSKKWQDCKLEVVDFTVGPNKICIESRIAKDFLKINFDEMIELFKGLCVVFTKFCFDNMIPCDPHDIFVAEESELQGPHCQMYLGKDGKRFGYIFLTSVDLKSDGLWIYGFLHELGHIWLSKKLGLTPSCDKELIEMELFTDLVAICVFRKIIPPHKRIYREIIKGRTYFGKQESKEYLGNKMHKQILNNPESFLKKIVMEKTKAYGKN